MSPESGLSIHMYLRNLYKIHVSGSVYKHPYVSQDPLQDPCPRNQVSASICISGTSARSMSPDPYISIHMYLRILCKIHVSDSCLSIFKSQGPLQDPCLRIHVLASLYLRILCKIHVSGSVYQHPYVSQDPLQDPCVRFMSQQVLAFMSQHPCVSQDPLQDPCISQDPLQDPCLRIHVSDSCLSIFVSQAPLQYPCLRIRM